MNLAHHFAIPFAASLAPMAATLAPLTAAVAVPAVNSVTTIMIAISIAICFAPSIIPLTVSSLKLSAPTPTISLKILALIPLAQPPWSAKTGARPFLNVIPIFPYLMWLCVNSLAFLRAWFKISLP